MLYISPYSNHPVFFFPLHLAPVDSVLIAPCLPLWLPGFPLEVCHPHVQQACLVSRI